MVSLLTVCGADDACKSNAAKIEATEAALLHSKAKLDNITMAIRKDGNGAWELQTMLDFTCSFECCCAADDHDDEVKEIRIQFGLLACVAVACTQQ